MGSTMSSKVFASCEAKRAAASCRTSGISLFRAGATSATARWPSCAESARRAARAGRHPMAERLTLLLPLVRRGQAHPGLDLGRGHVEQAADHTDRGRLGEFYDGHRVG